MPRNTALLSTEFLETAKKRVSAIPGRTESDLRRATSDLYYALFHRVCEALIEPIGVVFDSNPFKEMYRTLYRIPDHGFLEKRCKEVKGHSFSDAISAFANQIAVMKNKRELADYDPLATFVISGIENDVQVVTSVLENFNLADPIERVRFAYFVSLKGRKAE
ncbi:hypothetical protein SAMN05443999_102275 [Roseovarius azorensis]|uniref:HEPN domain-containing protein n=1 Tax=Roseovarius azorensis TaxID=1287727 RepID=A0A1H7K0E0_9RHOB|nr:hypothetical protein [Roseovarius azorensis]SEK79345.1 hypothetical protein SAMN05443999_102275 [Roseovarius azorensis]